MKKLTLLVAAVLASAALAKPLYVTVPRAYGSREAPRLEVSFAEKEPVELRVLKPKDLPAFLKGQQALRRAYDPPPTLANPGRALSRGFNAAGSPVDLLRFSLGGAFRKAVIPGLEDAPAVTAQDAVRLDQGPERLVGVPATMTLVRSQWLNLDLGGTDRDFTVPGFEQWNSSGGFQERSVVLDPLPPGVYVVQLVQGSVEGQVVLVVTDLTVEVKQTDTEVLVRVAGRDQLAKANVAVKVMAGKQAVEGKTNELGEVRLSTSEPRLIVTASLGDDTALVDTDFFSTLAVVPDVFLYSDRPIYKPGDTVRFRGVLRQPDSALARLFKPRKTDIDVQLVSDGPVVKGKAKVDEFGAFSGQLTVPTGLPTGVLRLVAKVDGPEHQSESRVQEYVKPTFFVEVLTEEETVTPGGELKAKLRARRYAGGAPKNTKYLVYLYRTQVDSPAWVDDSGLGGKGSVVTYGTPSTTEGTLSVPQKLYASAEGYGDVWEQAATFNDAGEAEITVSVPALEAGDARKPWRYSLSVRAKDDQGTFANASRAYFLAESDLLGTVLARQRVVRPGDVARFSVRATTLSGKTYGPTKGEVQFNLLAPDGSTTSLTKQEFTTGDDGVARVEVKGEKPGVVEAQVTLKDKKGLSWTGATTTLVLGPGGEAVMQVPTLTLEALGGAMQPGDTAEVVGLLPAGWGVREANEGNVWITLTGAGIFKTEKVPVKGQTVVYKFPIERRFGSAVYAALAYPSASGRWEERIAGFRIVPKERTLTVAVNAERPEAAPLTTQTLTLRVTDHQGRPVQAQVSVGVVDKAVYALQSEFRPGIVDFFYPVGRDNVSTFFSSEFQGYGYGDRIAQKLAGLPRRQFAAVKPPTKPQKEDDTVFWNPSVVTDRDGRATVTFKLNSMQTLWTVTAVAVDASGRFGEAGAEFATRGALVVAANVPQFLREGDSATGSIRVTPGQNGPGQGTVTLEYQGQGAAAFDVKRETLTLAKGGEAIVPVELKAERSGDFSLGLSAKGLGDPISDVKRLAVLPAAIEEDVAVSSVGGGALELTVPKGAQVLSSRLTLAPSMVDVALGNARELLTYPHGCVEQLVATTVPNVALYRTLERLKALDTLDKDSLTLLSEAKSRSVQGTSRILDMAVKGGGFTWFSGYQEPSLEMTLIALDGLAYAAEAGLLDKNDARLTESAAWLEARPDVPASLEATRTYVLSRLQGPRQAAKVRQLVGAAIPEDLYGLALAVLAAEHAGVSNEAEIKERIAALADESRKGVISNAVFRPDDTFFRYPLRNVGFTAILAHAASRKDVDVDRTRARVLQLMADPSLSTFERSTALLHSQWLIERDIKAMKKLSPPSLEGSTAELVPAGLGLSATIEPSAAQLKVGAFDGVATWRARVRIPLASVEARESGMSVKRAYFAVKGDQKVPLAGPVKQGEDVYVELTLDARSEDRWRSIRSAYYVLEDSIPAGFTVLQEDKAYRGAPLSLPLTHEALKKRAFSPERITWYFEEKAFWSASPRVIGYVLRANFPGTYVAPPATLEDMYASQVGARTASASVSIVK
jgi:hypothetical protein